jgi:hypothetical protein
MFADDRELQESIASNTRNLKHHEDTSTTATAASRASQSTALPQAFAPAPSQQFKPFYSSSSSIVLMKVVMVRKVGRDRFLKFACVCTEKACENTAL